MDETLQLLSPACPSHTLYSYKVLRDTASPNPNMVGVLSHFVHFATSLMFNLSSKEICLLHLICPWKVLISCLFRYDSLCVSYLYEVCMSFILMKPTWHFFTCKQFNVLHMHEPETKLEPVHHWLHCAPLTTLCTTDYTVHHWLDCALCTTD